MKACWGVSGVLAAGFGVACGVALAVVGARSRSAGTTLGDELGDMRPAPLVWRVAWRTQMTARPNAPTAVPTGGWMVTDQAGGVTALSEEGARLWRRVFSNQVFEAAAFVSGGLAVVASLDGQVAALRVDTGEPVWSAATDARFQHRPLGGFILDGAETVRLVSQADGRLVCFRLADGKRLWQSEPTTRCDGEPAAGASTVAYGNCDGAFCLFDAATGALQGSVPVGADDQMAGGVLALPDGRFLVGTRQGDLVLVDPVAKRCVARVKVSSEEAFLKPVIVFGGCVAMGSREGELSFWRPGTKGLALEGKVSLGAAVEQVASGGDRLFVLAGGTLRVMDALAGEGAAVSLGDDVYGLTARCPCMAACVADGAVVCLKGVTQ